MEKSLTDGLPSLTQLLRQLQRVPYLASKNLYRVAQHFLTMTPEQVAFFCQAIKDAHDRLVKCPICCAWQERTTLCVFCGSPKRDQGLICVVETWYDLNVIEKSGGYNGVYHVLGGALSPLDGIYPEDLSVDRLAKRVNQSHDGTHKPVPCREIILAMNQTPEGEATAALVARALQGAQVRISCLARGIPVGSSLELMDRLTINKALAERRTF